MKKFIFFLTLSLFWGCSNMKPPYEIDNETYVSKNFDKRIRSIILHYTALNDETSLKVLTQQKVSVHYVITTNDDDPIYSLVPDSERAWHAGVSEFENRTNFNDTSIGIEIVNLGYDSKRSFKSVNRDKSLNFRPKDYYYPFTEEQIKKVAYLVKELQIKYNISDKNILAHSDISPERKQDPGPYFPWKRLYFEYGIGNWYDESDKEFYMKNAKFSKVKPSTIKKYLKEYGYNINDTCEWDNESRKVIYAFQHRFRPEKSDGNVDLETYAIIRALHKKYVKK